MQKAIEGSSQLNTIASASRSLTDKERQAIESSGGRIIPLAEFLDLSEAQMRVIELQVRLTEAIRRLRSDNGLTQAALAKKLGVARPRIAEIEGHKKNVTLDVLFSAFFVVGGTSSELCEMIRATDECMK